VNRPRYADPERRYTAGFASPWRRASAAAIDWTVCLVAYVIVSIPLGGIQALGAASWREHDLGGLPGEVVTIAAQVLTVVPAIAYFAFLLPSSHTLGMRARDIRMISLRTGRAPSYVVAAVRAVLTVAVAASVYVLVQRATSVQDKGHLDHSSWIALQVAYVLAAGAGLSALLTSLTPSHRNLFDRLFGTAVVDELEAVVPQMGPWGPLNSFDLSYDGRNRRTSLPA
jgi:RDD family